VSAAANRDDMLRKALARLDALEARAREPIGLRERPQTPAAAAA